MSAYPYLGNPNKCAKCGIDKGLTKHHWKEPGATQNTPTNKRVEGIIVMVCRKCHDKIHGQNKPGGGKPKGGWKK